VNPEWFYSVGDTRQGPVSEAQLRELAADGTLKPADLVWKDGMPDWVDARTIPGLFPDRDTLRKSRPPVEEAGEVGDDRPRRQRRFDEDEDDDRRPSRRRRPADERDDYDEARRGPRRGGSAKPGQVQASAVMMLVGGILGLLTMLGVGASSIGFCCFWPGVYFEIVVCILMIVRASNMMNRDDYGPPSGLAVCQICFILNLDVVNMVLGIVTLVLLGSDEAKAYYRRRGF